MDSDLDGRVEGQVIVKPIVYGSISRLLEKNNEMKPHTHQWTIYLRPYEDEDMSRYIKKVVFKLHDSFEDNNRCLTSPPFEVTETGWGEFEAVIKIFFQCPKEKPVVLKHYLRLFQAESPDQAVVSEFYDEIVFQSPTQRMESLLRVEGPLAPLKHARNYEEEKTKTLQAILDARKKIKDQLAEAKSGILGVKEEMKKMKKGNREGRF